MSRCTPSRATRPWARADSRTICSEVCKGKRDGTCSACRSLVRSDVPITTACRGFSLDSLAREQMSELRSTPIGLSIMHQIGRSLRISCEMIFCASITTFLSSTFGMTTAFALLLAMARMSSLPHTVSSPLHLIATSLCPNPPLSISFTTFILASTFTSGATASSRSMITTSAGSVLALLMARVFDPGRNSTDLRGRKDMNRLPPDLSTALKLQPRTACITYASPPQNLA
mmetsp:Transcript_36439/g.113532  ORF Transcript_36439/g.113532 Transcript_36439/m.113532 type:complete len:230 (-) Transcript_36439:21-710(-)